ncbi:MAG: hypothetical protein IJT29_02960 [Oscillospiraceae bacterium]|nr:hypothetical protein [Oscillospiraceae bacterium]
MREGLYALIGLAFFCGAALYLCPEGGARRVLALLCTAVLTASVLSSLGEFDYASLTRFEARFNSAEAEITQTGRERGERLRLLLLEERAERYLAEKADALGLTLLEARIEAVRTEDGELLPYAASLRVAGAEESAEALSILLRDELKIPVERQEWRVNE